MPRSELEALLAWVEAWLEGTPPANVWIGATVVNQEEADRDIPKLLAVPATRRFLSMEPLLGPVDLTAIPNADGLAEGQRYLNVVRQYAWECHGQEYIDTCNIGVGIDWVIVGGESGPHARPMHPDWVRSLRDQCVAAGVPFFFKQWGEWAPNCLCNLEMDMAHRETKRPEPGKPGVMFRCGKQAAGRLLDGRTWDEVPG